MLLRPSTKPKRDLVVRLAEGGDAVPVTLDHVGKAFVGLQPLPFEASAPVVEEALRPALALVAPELAKALLEEVGGVEPLVGGQQQLERAPPLQAEVLAARQQGERGRNQARQGRGREHYFPTMPRFARHDASFSRVAPSFVGHGLIGGHVEPVARL